MLSENRQKQLINLCQEFIRTKSYSGEEKDLVEKLKSVFEEIGYDGINIDEYGNIIGCIRGNRPGKSILFDGHMDTVPVAEPAKWKHDPFGGQLEDGKIYGRGTSDMKGALSAMVLAAAYFAQDMNKDFAGNIYVAGVVHEECFEGVASRSISKRVQPDYVIGTVVKY